MNADIHGARVAQGGLITVASQAARLVVQFAGVVALTRLLSPESFGVMAVALVAFGVGEIIRDLGLSSRVAQAESMPAAAANNVFWMSVLSGTLVGSVLALSAWPLSRFYGDPALGTVLLVLALFIPMNAAQAQFQAHLARGLRFRALALSEVAAQMVALAAALIYALREHNHWALVVQVGVLSTLLLTLRGLLCEWRPGRPRAGGGLRASLQFGAPLSITQLLVFFSSNVDTLIVGRISGPSILGLYNRAFQLLIVPMNQLLGPLTNVALPVFSRLRYDRERYDRYLLRASEILSLTSSVLFAVAAASAPALIPLLFGPGWAGSVPLFQIFAVGGVFQSLNYSSYWVYLSLGLTRDHLKYSIVVRSIQVALILFASAHGFLWVAATYSITMVLSWPASLFWLRAVANLRVREISKTGLYATTVGLIAYGSGSGLAAAIAPHRVSIDYLIASALLTTVVYACLMGALSFGRAMTRNVLRTLVSARSDVPGVK